jgi:hypothetical protein
VRGPIILYAGSRHHSADAIAAGASFFFLVLHLQRMTGYVESRFVHGKAADDDGSIMVSLMVG